MQQKAKKEEDETEEAEPDNEDIDLIARIFCEISGSKLTGKSIGLSDECLYGQRKGGK